MTPPFIQTSLFDNNSPDNSLVQQLQEAEKRIEAFVEKHPALAWIKDSEGRYLYCNQALLDTYGKSAGELIGKTDAEIVSPAISAKHSRMLNRVIEQNTVVESVEPIPLPDGRIRYWQIRRFPYMANKTVEAVGGIATDITERIEAEEAVRISEERYQSLMEHAQDAIFSLSPDGILKSANSAFERITGWHRDRALDQPFLQWIVSSDRPRFEEAINELREGKSPPTLEILLRSVSTEAVPVEVTLTAQKQDYEITGILGIGRDIRKRKHLENQLRQVQKLESIGQLAAGIAHDFNNILSVIQGHTSLLAMTEALPGNTQDSIQAINQAAERAANLTRQLLMFSRKQVMQVESVSINQVVENITRMLSRLLPENIQLRSHLDESISQVSGDIGMLEQVIMNLAVNARDAMPEGGNLTLSTSEVEFGPQNNPLLEASPNTRFICLSVRDTGTGIPAEDLPHIYEPFFTTKEKESGTGLGLATVYGIIKQHSGHVDVESRLGQGTVFRIYLPAETADANKLFRQNQFQKAPTGSETILIVEDEPSVSKLVDTLLQKFGYRTLLAKDGVEAQKVWRRHSNEIDLLLTDLIMPRGISGGELAKLLQTEKPQLKVIFTSGYSSETHRKNLRLQEGLNFIPKPYMPQDLAQIVRRQLDAKRLSGT